MEMDGYIYIYIQERMRSRDSTRTLAACIHRLWAMALLTHTHVPCSVCVCACAFFCTYMSMHMYICTSLQEGGEVKRAKERGGERGKGETTEGY